MQVTEQNISDITPHIIGLLDEWKLTPEQILILLGLDEQVTTRDLRKFRSRSKALPYSDELAERIEHISGITDALQTTFPHNSEMRIMWLRKPHKRFQKARPLALILDEGLDGLIKVRIEVDCAYGWSLSEPSPKS
jgi:uncharacterized protein (DUF2384 family)